MSAVVGFLAPYEFSPTVLALTVTAGALFLRGMLVRRRRGGRTGFWRAASFFLGLGLTYVMLQTQLDYLAQHMFWIHRGQHLVLHHVGPVLMVLALPHEILGEGLPEGRLKQALRRFWRHPITRRIYGAVQHPITASLLFVGLIYLWLYPPVHFDAMLSVPLYKAMNWSMVVDGLLFWWLAVDPRSPARGGLGFGTRIIMLWVIMLPQIAIGAYISLSNGVLFDIYEVCGRAWPISPLLDQQIGGLLTWIPAAMMSVVVGLIVLRMWMRENNQAHLEAAGSEA
ncbi:cytochrome c oxidase assembly protein [Thiohalorhabdus methylotrophus]|uniref:Cytochrome c oxidase assembly protein n=1 Tax=Thiohalorhabdus methylotrophus TaxID=3242694 RepID=A0ABV4TUG0_9GAMM